MTTGIAIHLPRSQVELIRTHTKQHSETKPGHVLAHFVKLAIQDMKRRYYSDVPEIGGMTPKQRNQEQIRLNLEYLRERGFESP